MTTFTTNNLCLICSQPINSELNHTLVELSCKHVFHETCLNHHDINHDDQLKCTECYIHYSEGLINTGWKRDDVSSKPNKKTSKTKKKTSKNNKKSNKKTKQTVRCTGFTKRNTRCKRKTFHPSDKCHFHL